MTSGFHVCNSQVDQFVSCLQGTGRSVYICLHGYGKFVSFWLLSPWDWCTDMFVHYKVGVICCAVPLC